MEAASGQMRVTKTVYTVSDFIDWQSSLTLDLHPYYQRGSVWTPKSKSYLIDTLLRGYPVPIIYLQSVRNRERRTVRQVVDGQQRLRTLISYIDRSLLKDATPDDDFTILRSHNETYAGHTFDELPKEVQQSLLDTELSVHVLPPDIGDKHLLQLFARLNSTGERLNDQELRNAAYHGEFKSVVYDLSYEQLQRWTEWDIFTRRAIAQMRDVELVSELVIFLLEGLQRKSKSSIDTNYRYYDDLFPFADEVTRRFRWTFDFLQDLLDADLGGDGNDFRSQSWLYALFAVISSLEFGDPLEETPSWRPSHERRSLRAQPARRSLEAAQVALREATRAGTLTEALAKALRGASADRSSRQARYDFLLQFLAPDAQ